MMMPIRCQKLTTNTPKAYDEYLTAEVLLPIMGNVTKANVTGRKRDADGNPIGKRNVNPMLDTREYEVVFPDGVTDVFTANIIVAENLNSHVDEEGNSYSIMSEITDHKSDGSAVTKDDDREIKDGNRRPR